VEWGGQTVPVDSFEANPWGLFNVHGNVFEWCEDVWHDNYDGAPTDGSAWLEGGDDHWRVVRGGSWYVIPRFLRSADRDRGSTDFRIDDFGFRLARTLNP
jgi:formylglycine-generating enzyme required for sulfatase activity